MSILIQRRIPKLYNETEKKTKNLEMYTSKSSHWWWILGAQRKRVSISESPVSEKILDQVKLDVERAFCFDSSFSSVDIVEKRERLYKIITRVLSRNPSFKYYQGFHEICSLFSTVFEDSEEKCVFAAENFASDFLNDFLTDSFDNLLRQYTEKTLFIVTEYTIEMGKVRRCSVSEKDRFKQFITNISELVEPHGLMASWFLTWFVHEFPDFEDSLKIFDFQLVELKEKQSPIYVASALLMIYRDLMFNWKEDPFELIMFLRNLPKIAQIREVIEYARIIHRAHNEIVPTSRRKINLGNRFWLTIIIAHFVYYVLSVTIFPKLKYL